MNVNRTAPPAICSPPQSSPVDTVISSRLQHTNQSDLIPPAVFFGPEIAESHFSVALSTVTHLNDAIDDKHVTKTFPSYPDELVLTPLSISRKNDRGYELNLTSATNISKTTSGTVHEGSVMVLLGYGPFFVKASVACLMKIANDSGEFKLCPERELTPEEQQFFVIREVVATRQTALQALHDNGAPEAFVGIRNVIGTNNIPVKHYYVATRFLEHFIELDNLLINRDFINTQLDSISSLSTRNAIIQNVNLFKTLQKRLNDFRKNDAEWYLSKDVAHKQSVKQLRELREELVKEVLPTYMKVQLIEHVENDFIIGELDTVNSWGQNLGFIKTQKGQWQLIALDRGTSYDVGFWGTSKDKDCNCTAKIQRPYILQSDSSLTARVSLPDFRKGSSHFPYPEDIKTIYCEDTAAYHRQTILFRLSYHDMLLEGNGTTQSAFDHNFALLPDTPPPSLLERGLKTRNEIINTDRARRRARILEAGGEEAIIRWARENPHEAEPLEALAHIQRTRMGIS